MPDRRRWHEQLADFLKDTIPQDPGSAGFLVFSHLRQVHQFMGKPFKASSLEVVQDVSGEDLDKVVALSFGCMVQSWLRLLVKDGDHAAARHLVTDAADALMETDYAAQGLHFPSGLAAKVVRLSLSLRDKEQDTDVTAACNALPFNIGRLALHGDKPDSDDAELLTGFNVKLLKELPLDTVRRRLEAFLSLFVLPCNLMVNAVRYSDRTVVQFSFTPFREFGDARRRLMSAVALNSIALGAMYPEAQPADRDLSGSRDIPRLFPYENTWIRCSLQFKSQFR